MLDSRGRQDRPKSLEITQMEAIAAVKPGVKTVNVKKSGVVTKSMRDAQEAAGKLGAVIIPIGNGGGHTLVTKAEAERRRLIDAAKADLAAESANSAEQIVDPIPADQKAGARRQPGAKKKASQVTREMTEDGTMTTVAEVVEAPAVEEPAVAPAPKVVKPYNPEPLSGAAEAGKQPKKGQLPAGLLAYLAKKHAGSQVIAAAAGGPAKKAKKAKK